MVRDQVEGLVRMQFRLGAISVAYRELRQNVRAGQGAPTWPIHRSHFLNLSPRPGDEASYCGRSLEGTCVSAPPTSCEGFMARHSRWASRNRPSLVMCLPGFTKHP